MLRCAAIARKRINAITKAVLYYELGRITLYLQKNSRQNFYILHSIITFEFYTNFTMILQKEGENQMVQNVFNRIEKKYLLNETQYQAMRKALEPYMQVDNYGLHTIRNIYFDTKENELVRRSIEKPKYKEKFRIRCYGQPKEESDIFLEIKKKYNGLVNKRRMTLKPDEAKAYLADGKVPEKQGQIFHEIDFFLKRYALKPALYLAYDRIALFGNEDHEFRVTFDQNIRSRNENLTLFSDEDTTELLEPGYHLMEVKVLNAMPLWFVKILSELEIRNTSFSKYGCIYQKQLEEGKISYTANRVIYGEGVYQEELVNNIAI